MSTSFDAHAEAAYETGAGAVVEGAARLTDSEPIGLSVVVPLLNEAESLLSLDEEIREALASVVHRSEIIYVNDGSTDESARILSELVSAHRLHPVRTRVVSLRRNYGQTAALAAGFDLAAGRITLPLDADGQNNPADIPRMIARLDQGFDVVSGWRRSRKDLLVSRKLPSLFANWLASKVSGVELHDFGCTLKAYRTSCLREVRLYGEMHRFLPVYLKVLGARITEMEVDHRPRLQGRSKYGRERVLKVVVDLVLMRFLSRYYTRPMHFFGRIAAWFFCFAVSIGITMLVFKFGWLHNIGVEYEADFIRTPLPALAATCFLGGVMSLFFGILGEILIRIHHESSGRLPYLIDSVGDSDCCMSPPPEPAVPPSVLGGSRTPSL